MRAFLHVCRCCMADVWFWLLFTALLTNERWSLLLCSIEQIANLLVHADYDCLDLNFWDARGASWNITLLTCAFDYLGPCHRHICRNWTLVCKSGQWALHQQLQAPVYTSIYPGYTFPLYPCWSFCLESGCLTRKGLAAQTHLLKHPGCTLRLLISQSLGSLEPTASAIFWMQNYLSPIIRPNALQGARGTSNRTSNRPRKVVVWCREKCRLLNT